MFFCRLCCFSMFFLSLIRVKASTGMVGARHTSQESKVVDFDLFYKKYTYEFI